MRQGSLILAAGRVRSKKKKSKKKNNKKSAPPKTHHEIHSSPATATNSRRRATKQFPRGSPYSHASSIDPVFVEISLACIHTYPNCCCCCAACTRFGALHLARAASAFATVICISGFGVVRLCLTLSFQSAHGIRKLDVHCCAQGVFCCCCFLQQTAERHRATVYGVRHNFPNFMQWSGNARTILCQSEHETIPPHPKHTHINKQICISGNSLYGPAS